MKLIEMFMAVYNAIGPVGIILSIVFFICVCIKLCKRR